MTGIVKLPEKRERRWLVLRLVEEDHAMMQKLGTETGHADRHAALVDLEQIVKTITEDDLDDFPKRRPLKLGLPAGLDDAVKAKSEELGCTFMRVLLSAAQVMVEQKAKKKSAKTPKPKKSPKSPDDAKVANGVMADSE